MAHTRWLQYSTLKRPILAFDQIGKSAIFDVLGRAYVRDSSFSFVLLRYDYHARVSCHRERNPKWACTGPAFDRIDESRVLRHNPSEMGLNLILDFDEQCVLPFFAPREQLVLFFLKLI